MIAFRNVALATAISASCALLISQDVMAFDATGAWAARPGQCSKVFVRKGRNQRVTFTNLSSVYGGGFIIDADRLRGKFENCAIKERNQSEGHVNLIAACASGIMLSNVQFSLKLIDDNTLIREFPGIEGRQVKYHRCQI